VGPALLPSFLVEVDRDSTLLVERGLEVTEQRGLLLVAREEAPCEIDLVEAEPGVASTAGVHHDVVLRAEVFGDRQRDSLLGLGGKGSPPQFRAHPRVGAKRGGRAGQRSDEVVELAAPRQGALEDRRASGGRGQLVVNVEPADLGHLFTFLPLLPKMPPTNKNAP